MSYSTQNLGSLMDDLGSEEGAGGGKSKSHRRSSGQPFWKSQGFVIALAVVALAVFVGGAWYSFFSGGAPRPPSSMMLIDVNTGELFEAKLGKRTYVIPAKNPDTGDRSIFPVSESEDGRWIINSRYLEILEEAEYSSSVVVDLNRGEVHPTSESIGTLK